MDKYAILIVSLGIIGYGIYIIKTGRAHLKGGPDGRIELEGEDASCLGVFIIILGIFISILVFTLSKG